MVLVIVVGIAPLIYFMIKRYLQHAEYPEKNIASIALAFCLLFPVELIWLGNMMGAVPALIIAPLSTFFMIWILVKLQIRKEINFEKGKTGYISELTKWIIAIIISIIVLIYAGIND